MIFSGAAWAASKAWGTTTEKATEPEKAILAILMALSLTTVAIILFLFYRAFQAHKSRTELMERLESMEKKLKTIEAPRRFDDWDQAQPEIQRLINNSFTDFDHTELQCLGVALHVSWKTVRERLETYHKLRGKYPKVTVRLKVLSSEWRHWDKLGRAWRRRNESFYESVTEFIQKVQGNPDVTITVSDYDYTPNWHGVLINGRHLFRSSCLYRDNEFTVHKNPYVFFRLEENEYSDMQIAEFSHWFTHESRERSLDELKKTAAINAA